jgi:hypothetical protein
MVSANVGVSARGLTVRYFAYGANMAKSVREGRRRLVPLSTAPGFVRDERLAFNVPGFGPAEPAFASIQRAKGEEIHGGCFELSVDDWLRVCATEGVPIGYRVRAVDVQLYSGETVPAFTLDGNGPWPFGDLPPSPRYLALLRVRESGSKACPTLFEPWSIRESCIRLCVRIPCSQEGANELELTRSWQERLASVQPAPLGTRAPSGNELGAFETRQGETFI